MVTEWMCRPAPNQTIHSGCRQQKIRENKNRGSAQSGLVVFGWKVRWAWDTERDGRHWRTAHCKHEISTFIAPEFDSWQPISIIDLSFFRSLKSIWQKLHFIILVHFIVCMCPLFGAILVKSKTIQFCCRLMEVLISCHEQKKKLAITN